MQNLTTYTDTDPNSRTSITSSRCTVTELTRNEDCFTYYDFTTDYFGGDFEHLMAILWDADDAGSSRHSLWALTNDIDDSKWLTDNSKPHLHAMLADTVGGRLFRLREYDGSSGYSDDYIASLDTVYHWKVSRDWGGGDPDFGTLYLYIYEDDGGEPGDLLDTLELSLHSQVAFRYHFVCMSHNSGQTDWITSYVENINLLLTYYQGVGAASLSIAGSLLKKGFVDAGQGSIALAGALIKKISIGVGSGAVTLAGALSTIFTQFQAVGDGAVALAGALSTIFIQVVDVGAGAVGLAGSLIKKTSIGVGSGAVSLASSLARIISVGVGDASLAIAGALGGIRIYAQTVGQGAISIAGTVAGVIVASAQAVGDGTVAIAGSLAKYIKVTLSIGTVSIAGHAYKTMYQACGNALFDIRGYITDKTIYKAVGGASLTIVGALATSLLNLASVGNGAISIAGSLTKKTIITVGDASLSLVGALTKLPKILVGYGTVSLAGALVKKISIGVGGGAIALWSKLNGWISGPPMELTLTFDTSMDLELTFDTSMELDLTFTGGRE